MKVTTKLPKRNNATNGRKAHNDNQYVKIGRVRMNSWINEKLPVADILIAERELVHISHKRASILNKLGLDSFAYVSTIVANCSEIYIDDETHAYLFVLKNANDNPTAHCAVVEIELAFLNQKRVYIIRTAHPESRKRLSQNTLLCAKAASHK